VVNHLAHMRQARHLSRRQLAAMVGVSKEAIRLLELGQRRPSMIIAYKIAEALGVSVEQIWPKPGMDDTSLTETS